MRKILAYLIVFLSFNFSAQEYKFNTFGQEEGLPQPYVYDIVQIKNGFLYVATGDGLASFDGFKFKKFTNKNGLAENYCSSLYFDSKKRLWIGHFEGGISYLENNKFNKLKTSDFDMARIIGIAEDSKGNIYYANSAGGLFIIKENKISKFTEEEMPPINEIKIYGDILYVASQEGLRFFNLSNRSRASETLKGSENKNIKNTRLSSKNELWVAIEGEGVSVFNKNQDEFKAITTFSAELKSDRKNIKDICLKGDNEVWISLTGEGICVIKFTSNFQVEKSYIINSRNGLKSVFINKIFQDKEENLWLGSTGNGLFQFLSSRFELFSSNNILPFDDIRTVAVDDSDNVYICDDRQFFAFNLKANRYYNQRLIPENEEQEIRCNHLIRAKNELWIGTTKALHIFDVTKGIVKLKKTLAFFNDKTINYITRDANDNVLVCTTEGLFFLDKNYEPEKVFNTDMRAPHNNFLGCLADRKGKLWIFSPETPLYNLYKDEVSLEKTLDTLASFRFGSAVQDKDENIWFATEGDGIFVLDKYKKFKHYGTEAGLSSDFIYGIIASQKGDIVATHKNGISIKYSNLKTFRPIDKSTGLPANNVNTNALYRDKKGQIWMGTTEGLIKYTPSEDRININPPVFSLLSVELNNTKKPVNDTLQTLNYNNYELVFNFIGISLTNPKGVSYRYKLEGYEEKFRITDEISVTYPKLNDGTYRFVIYAKNADGFETPEPLVYKIIIKKPFWKEVWFFVVVALVIGLTFYFIFKIRTKNLLKAKIELEGLVMEKTAELVKEKEKIEEANELLNEKNKDITASIAYAKRIQRAILPDNENIKNKVDLFVLYKPRDIVSGDFYWHSETNKYTYIAVVDCTGHGVPGAFMSLLGSTFLDQALSENKDDTPSKLLNQLDHKLHSAFKTREEENRIGDGMDALILRYDKTTKELMFSGANRPLYYYPVNGDPQDFKAPIYSVGGAFSNELKGYYDTTLSVSEGDCAYLFSDGFGDQFGGPRNKRYSTKRMKAYFNEIRNLSTEEQLQNIDNEFETWKGNEEQMDDICVIGIKF